MTEQQDRMLYDILKSVQAKVDSVEHSIMQKQEDTIERLDEIKARITLDREETQKELAALSSRIEKTEWFFNIFKFAGRWIIPSGGLLAVYEYVRSLTGNHR